MMTRDCDSFEVVKAHIMPLIPVNISLKHRIEDGVAVISTEEHELHFLNGVAGDFLVLCNGKATIQEIIDRLFEMYDVAKDILTDDIVCLIQYLQRNQIIRVEMML